jgi:hypothetical protein
LLTAQLAPTSTEEPALLALPHKAGTEPNVSTDVILAESGTSPHKHAFALPVNSGMDSPVLSVQTEEHGTSTPNHVNAQSPQPGTELPVLLALEEESTTTSPTNANAQAAKLSMDLFALSTAQLVNSTMKPSRDAHARPAKTGMVTSVSSVSVDKPGTPLLTLVSAHPAQFGTVTHALTHAQEEEFSTMSADNASVPLVTGMALHASSAQILKFGPTQD